VQIKTAQEKHICANQRTNKFNCLPPQRLQASILSGHPSTLADSESAPALAALDDEDWAISEVRERLAHVWTLSEAENITTI